MFESWHAFKLAMGRRTRPSNLKPAKLTTKYPNSPFLKPKPQISQRRRQILIKTFNGSYCFTKCLRSLLSSMFAHLTQFFHVFSGNSFTSKWRNMPDKLCPKALKVTLNFMSLKSLSYIESSTYTTTETTTLRWVLRNLSPSEHDLLYSFSIFSIYYYFDTGRLFSFGKSHKTLKFATTS